MLSKLFTRPVFLALAKGQSLRETLPELYRSGVLSNSLSELNAFNEAYEDLRKNYRNEYVYKTTIANKVIFGRHSPKTASLSLELPVGKSVVDMAIFNGTSTAYEIKTEFDSTRRLATQTSDYLSAFDKTYIVTSPNSVKALIEVAPLEVGILSIGKNERIKTEREAKSNLLNVDQSKIFRILRQSEYIRIVEHVFNIKIDQPNGILPEYCANLFRQIEPTTAHELFVAAMRSRTTEPKMAEFVSALPKHLKALGYAVPLSKPQRSEILHKLTV